MKVIKCFGLSKDKSLSKCHCPLSKDEDYLVLTYDYQVKHEYIVKLEIDSRFVCYRKQDESCSNCPFVRQQSIDFSNN